MAYDRDLESDKEVKQKHDEAQRAMAAERLKKNAAWNQAHRKRKDK